MYISSNEEYERRPVILFADHDEVVLDIGVKMLQFMDYRVLRAKSMQEVIEKFNKNQNKVDLIVMNLNMPDGGEDALGQLKRVNNQVNIIITCANCDDPVVSRLLDNGCSGFLSKPWTISMLFKKVTAALENYPDRESGYECG